MLSSNGYINSQLFQDIRCTAFTGYTTIAMLRYRYATGCNYKGSRRRDIKGSHLVTTGAYDIHNIKHLLIEGCGFFKHYWGLLTMHQLPGIGHSSSESLTNGLMPKTDS